MPGTMENMDEECEIMIRIHPLSRINIISYRCGRSFRISLRVPSNNASALSSHGEWSRMWSSPPRAHLIGFPSPTICPRTLRGRSNKYSRSEANEHRLCRASVNGKANRLELMLPPEYNLTDPRIYRVATVDYVTLVRLCYESVGHFLASQSQNGGAFHVSISINFPNVCGNLFTTPSLGASPSTCTYFLGNTVPFMIPSPFGNSGQLERLHP
uniref:Uncharacterized protein n=1 Tax=Steinernema glaseri TaxID=37863 RepID=A0A1I7Z7R3_9BILA